MITIFHVYRYDLKQAGTKIGNSEAVSRVGEKLLGFQQRNICCQTLLVLTSLLPLF